MAEHDRIELRSEKVRNIIGEVPPALVRSGIGIVFMLILLLLLATYIIPYPDTVKVDITVKTGSNHAGEAFAEALVPYTYATRIHKKMRVKADFEGYERKEHGFVEGVVTDVESRIVTHNDKNYFIIRISLHDNDYDWSQAEMRGTAFILLSDKTIWEHLF